MKKLSIVKCRYKSCPYGGIINRDTDDFVEHGGHIYYHKDCYKAKVDKENKVEKTKVDLKEFRKLWCENISNTVVWSQLNKVLKEYLDRGVESDQLLFTLKYVIKHKWRLNYPPGFRYYIDNDEVKNAYKQEIYRRAQIKQSQRIIEIKKDEPQKFKVPKKKTLDDLFD